MLDRLHDLAVGSPVVGLASTSADSFLKSALDEVEAGLIVVGQDFEVEFINRAFYRMWALPSLSDGDSYVLADIVEHGRRTGLYLTDPASLEDYVRLRRGQLRLADGRVLRFECKPLPGGRRMMTFTDISDLVHTADQLRDFATIDDLTRVSNRRQFLQGSVGATLATPLFAELATARGSAQVPVPAPATVTRRLILDAHSRSLHWLRRREKPTFCLKEPFSKPFSSTGSTVRLPGPSSVFSRTTCTPTTASMY